MSVSVPPLQRILGSDDPGVGSVTEVEAAVDYLAWARQSFDYAISDMNSALHDLSSHRGEAVRRLRGRLEAAVLPGVGLAAESASLARGAMAAYAEALRDVQHRAAAIVEQGERALDSMRIAGRALERLAESHGFELARDWSSPVPLEMPFECGPVPIAQSDQRPWQLVQASQQSSWRNHAISWNAAIEVLESCRSLWSALTEQRADCERMLVSCLHSTELGELLHGGHSPHQQHVRVSRAVVGYSTAGLPAVGGAFEALLDGALSAQQAAEVWREVAAHPESARRLIEQHCYELASVNGIPFAVQHFASTVALRRALGGRLDEAYQRMGFLPGEIGMRQFEHRLRAIDASHRRALEIAGGAGVGGQDPGAQGHQVHLVGLGRHDGALTAALSLGDLDRAPRVGMLVSGMNSDVTQFEEAFDAFESIRAEGDGDIAMVSWIGYRAPTVLEEPFQRRADSGGLALAGFIDGFTVVSQQQPPERLVVIAHSYGSNTASEALKIVQHPVDAFVTLGSAGLKPGTTTGQLNATQLFATHASGDQIAWLGRMVSFNEGFALREDPRELPGSGALSSEQSPEAKRVTMHNLRHPIDWGAIQPLMDHLNPWETDHVHEIGYLHPESTTVHELRKVMLR